MKITLAVNGKRHELDVQPMRRLLDVLREDLHLTGTKEGCGEGECGACAVHIDGVLLNACQVPVFQVHGRNILTVEGLGTPQSPDPVQTAFVAEGGVQCGFCTPGLLMASRALLNGNPEPSVLEIRTGLSGNLCRCTGYGRVVRAVQMAAGSTSDSASDSVSMASGSSPEVGPAVPSPGDDVLVAIPTSINEALGLLANGDYTIFAGGTDLMAAFHAGKPLPAKVLDVSRLRELTEINPTPQGASVGAAVRYAELHGHSKITMIWPALAEAARLVGAPAVQNAGTVGGNLVNASPGADLVPVLAALNGVVVLVSQSGERRVPVTAFYRGYRDCDRRPDELVKAVELPRPSSDLRQVFFKAGTRRAQSIARVNLACCGRLDEAGYLRDVRLVAGSVGPTIMTLRKTMAYLEGRSATQEGLAAAAGNLACNEVSPIDDVRSTAEYRRTVTGNLVVRFLRTFDG